MPTRNMFCYARGFSDVSEVFLPWNHRGLRTPEQLAKLTQVFPLAVIPFMPNEQDLSRAIDAATCLEGPELASW